MPIVEAKIASAMEAAIMSELSSAFAGPDAPPDGADSNKKLAAAVAKGVAKILAQTLLADAQVSPGIPVATAGSPAAQTGATTAPGKLM